MDQQVRPIDANALKKRAIEMEIFTLYGGDGTTMAVEVDAIESAPTLDYAPVRHGEWSDGAFENSKRCTRCGLYASKVYAPGKAVWDYIYCPHCGALMDGGKKDGCL